MKSMKAVILLLPRPRACLVVATVLVTGAVGVFSQISPPASAAGPSPTPIVIVIPVPPTPTPSPAGWALMQGLDGLRVWLWGAARTTPTPTPTRAPEPATPTMSDAGWTQVQGADGLRVWLWGVPLTLTPTPTASPSPTASCIDDAAYVADVTVRDNTTVLPGQRIDKTWRVRNTGTCRWQTGSRLAFQSGDHISGPDSQEAATIEPGQTTDITVILFAPKVPGTYTGAWMMQDAQGVSFGQKLTVVIQVPSPHPPTPTATPAPPLKQFSAKLVKWYPNCGISLVKGKIVEKNGAPVNGLRVRIWADGWDGALSLVSGVGLTYGPGQWDITLRPGQTGHFKVAVWDWQTGPSTYIRVDSEVLVLDFDYTTDNCKPEGSGHQVAQIKFTRNY